ncbi:Hypothetical predicted protein [Lecanosticta acicola]|uniref:Uncharacterized protein n=1 Tax=Lecanosticta acicola TaxID=111012 RepID=A0AAI8Z6C0_9PEZI|nr:Hypothetical predicted protein [Lecanosticta acicola]
MALQLGRSPLLRPVAALAGWTFVMQTWMHVTRVQAIGQYNVSVEPDQIKEDVNKKIPISIAQIADNFNHLHEQPTVFYAVALSLAMIGDSHDYTILAAWGYVGVRIMHSLFQATVNKVMVRFPMFASSSVVLAGLTARLAQLVY